MKLLQMKKIKICILVLTIIHLASSQDLFDGLLQGIRHGVQRLQSNIDKIMQNCILAVDNCPNQKVKFYLYTKETQADPELLDLANENSIMNAKLSSKIPTKIIIHGYTGHKDFEPNTSLRQAYFKNGNYNIISIDFHPLVKIPCYIPGISNLKVVARCTAQLIDFLVDKSLINFDTLHVLGFSMGAHTAGQIANYLKNGKRLKRITGLDPAQPGFIALPKILTLDEDDAEFVDVLHTDINMRGIFYRAGHVDFYPNSGYDQPGCAVIDTMAPSLIYSCNHDRSPIYFAESINSDVGFWASLCPNIINSLSMCSSSEENLILFGEHVPSSVRGTYYFNTNAEKPFAKGK